VLPAGRKTGFDTARGATAESTERRRWSADTSPPEPPRRGRCPTTRSSSWASA